ncbi:Multiple epidermal growth factor-like domains protein 8 [Linnemannia schmuckeri]|uniref:Multiple epidermal growth factor-like domains protein 8 n=1 Tax=Linnemannia schmuckeri TaxID=64567 RepID=A0A9P5RTY3_9FUNG|nr:Multiple epidermal growth factor-like domains protein 8 [Linnemannia schmuckeri]
MSTTTASPRRFPSRLFTITALLSLALFTAPTKAQVSYDAPIPVSGPAHARTSLKWYILSGQPSTVDGTLPIDQFFYLDLASPWSATIPAWKRLQPGPQQSIFPAVFTADQKTMVVFHIAGQYSVYKYTVATDSWAPSSINFPGGGTQGVGAVTDPNTGLVYLAGGYTDRGSMDIYNPAADTASQVKLPDPATTFPSRWYYSNTWSKQRRSVLYFGGYNITNNAANNAISEYNPSTSTWYTMATSGTAPTTRADHCMASNDDGTKVVVYGGRLANNSFSGELFILDTVTGAWTQGASGQPRVYAACTIAGDQLLIWGGTTTGSIMAGSPVLIYNMGTNAWIPDYTPPASYVASANASATAAKPTGTGTGGDAAGGGGSNTGAIVGGIVGAIAVIGAIAGFLIYRRRQQRNTYVHTPVNTHSDDKETGAAALSPTSVSGGSSSNEEELRRMQSQLENQQRQLELQRQLLALQQQSTAAASQPVMVQYQDPSTPYGYQPPLYYPPVPISPHTVQTVPDTSSSSYAYSNSIPVTSGGGHSEIYQVTAEPNFAPSPLVYMPADYILPPGSASSPTVPTTAGSSSGGASGDVSPPFAVGAPVKKSQGQVSGPQAYVNHAGSWTSDKPQPNNPHTVLD